NEIEFLIDDGNSEIFGVAGREDSNGLAIDEDGSGIGSMGTGEDANQSGFSGTVFSHQCVDFAGLKIETDVFERMDAWEGFVDSFHPQERSLRGGDHQRSCFAGAFGQMELSSWMSNERRRAAPPMAMVPRNLLSSGGRKQPEMETRASLAKVSREVRSRRMCSLRRPFSSLSGVEPMTTVVRR